MRAPAIRLAQVVHLSSGVWGWLLGSPAKHKHMGWGLSLTDVPPSICRCQPGGGWLSVCLTEVAGTRLLCTDSWWQQHGSPLLIAPQVRASLGAAAVPVEETTVKT